MDKLQIPDYIEPEIVETTFMATQEDTYFIWLERYGEEEAEKLWHRCYGNEPLPAREKQVA